MIDNAMHSNKVNVIYDIGVKGHNQIAGTGAKKGHYSAKLAVISEHVQLVQISLLTSELGSF